MLLVQWRAEALRTVDVERDYVHLSVTPAPAPCPCSGGVRGYSRPGEAFAPRAATPRELGERRPSPNPASHLTGCETKVVPRLGSRVPGADLEGIAGAWKYE